ncbi:MAG: hypothetical protein ABEJ83_04770 [Candidatus Nanohaloarchaea archaeon]
MVSDEKDRRIFSILAHGEKQRIEIVELIKQYEDVSEDAVDNRLDNIIKYYEEVEKEERRDGTYYYRTDLDPVPSEIIRPKKPADKDQVNDLLSGLEHRLGIKEEEVGPTTSYDARSELLRKLLNMAMNNKFLLHDDKTLERYLQIYDEYIDRMRKAYKNFEPGQLEKIPDPMYEHRLLFQLTRELHSNSKQGQENYRLGYLLNDRLNKIEECLSDFPAGLGIECLGLARELNENSGKEFYKLLVLLDRYKDQQLLREAFYTYDVHNDIDELIYDLSIISEKADDDTSQRIRGLINDITSTYIEHPVNPRKQDNSN